MPEILTVLTGATRGLGHALYRELRSRGETVIVIGRRLEGLRAEKEGPILVEFDLARAAKPDAAVRLAELLGEALAGQVFDRLVFISNAGIVEPIGQVGGLGPADVAAAAAINLVAPAIIADTCWRAAELKGAAFRVLNISSGAALRPIPGWAAYCATKAGARMFFDVLAAEEGGAEVRHIDPGVVDTDMQAVIRSTDHERFPLVEQFVTLAQEGRLQTPEAVAERILREHFP